MNWRSGEAVLSLSTHSFHTTKHGVEKYTEFPEFTLPLAEFKSEFDNDAELRPNVGQK